MSVRTGQKYLSTQRMEVSKFMNHKWYTIRVTIGDTYILVYPRIVCLHHS